MTTNTSDIFTQFAHAGHNHPEHSDTLVDGDGLLIGGVLVLVAVVVLGLVLFDTIRKRNSK